MQHAFLTDWQRSKKQDVFLILQDGKPVPYILSFVGGGAPTPRKEIFRNCSL